MLADFGDLRGVLAEFCVIFGTFGVLGFLLLAWGGRGGVFSCWSGDGSRFLLGVHGKALCLGGCGAISSLMVAMLVVALTLSMVAMVRGASGCKINLLDFCVLTDLVLLIVALGRDGVDGLSLVKYMP